MYRHVTSLRAGCGFRSNLLRNCQTVTTNRKDLKLSFTEGWNPFQLLWGKEQRLGYLQQRCTHWLANLRWGDGKVATFRMAFVCHALACQHLHASRLWRGSGCDFHRTPMSSRHNSAWPTDRERLGYVCNPHSLMEGTETLCPHATILNHRWLPGTHSRLLSGKPDEWMHLSPFYTHMHGEWLRYAKFTSQYSLTFSL